MLDHPVPPLDRETRLHVALTVIRELSQMGRPQHGMLVAEDRIRQALYELRTRESSGG